MSCLVRLASLLVWYTVTQAGIPPAAHFVGTGYNLLKGNPDGGTTSRGGVDPGLLSTRSIFQLSPGKIPREIVYNPRYSCAQVQTTSVFYGTKSYQNKLRTGVKTSGGASAVLAGFAFSLSGGYNSTREKTTRERQVFRDNQEVCNLGRARFAEELAASDHFSVSRGFAAAICKLSGPYNRTKYMDFINDWGTHVVMELELGTRRVNRSKASLSQFVEHAMTEGNAGITLGGSYMGYSASVGVDFNKYSNSQALRTNFGTYQYTLTSGTRDLPEPIGIRTVTIDEALLSKYWTHFSDFVNDGLCSMTGTSADQLLSEIRMNLIQALSEYPSFMRAPTSVDPPLLIPVTWPQGSYGLVKPLTGCPAGHFLWREGKRLQDTDEYWNDNVFSAGLHLYGVHDQQAVETSFCIKGQTTVTDYDVKWGKGDYCILKYGQCPDGFQTGYVNWDDRDQWVGQNKNSFSGILPDGQYDDNTRIEFCCRNDSLPTEQIILPTEKPFYLFRNTRTCQEVAEMTSRDEYIEIGTVVLFNDDKESHVHPYDDGDAHSVRLHYCYYDNTVDTHVSPLVG